MPVLSVGAEALTALVEEIVRLAGEASRRRRRRDTFRGVPSRRAKAAPLAFAKGAVRVRRSGVAEGIAGLVVGVTTHVEALARLASNAAEPAGLARAPAAVRPNLVFIAPLLALLDAAVLGVLGAAAAKVAAAAFAKGAVRVLAAGVAERLARFHADIALDTRVAGCKRELLASWTGAL